MNPNHFEGSTENAPRRERNNLRAWLRRWRMQRFLYDTDCNLVGLADMKSFETEFEAALRGEAPARRRK